MRTRRAIAHVPSGSRLLLVAFCILALSAPGYSQRDPAIGKWKLNVAKSIYRPGVTPPKSALVTIEPAGQGIKVTARTIGGDGQTTEMALHRLRGRKRLPGHRVTRLRQCIAEARGPDRRGHQEEGRQGRPDLPARALIGRQDDDGRDDGDDRAGTADQHRRRCTRGNSRVPITPEGHTSGRHVPPGWRERSRRAGRRRSGQPAQ